MLALLALSVLAGATDGLRLEAGLFGALPASLETGQVLGPSVTALWAQEGWSFGARARLGMVAEDDLAWSVHHTEIRLSALAGWAHRLGRGALGLTLSGGAVIVGESATRHQAARLERAGLDASRSGWTTGPQLGLDLSVRLAIVRGWGVAIEGGPSLGWVPDHDVRLGWSGGLSLSYALEGT